MGEGNNTALCVAFAIIAIGFFFVALDNSFIIKKLKEEAIERGYAQHNSKTGDWEWKDNAIVGTERR